MKPILSNLDAVRAFALFSLITAGPEALAADEPTVTGGAAGPGAVGASALEAAGGAVRGAAAGAAGVAERTLDVGEAAARQAAAGVGTALNAVRDALAEAATNLELGRESVEGDKEATDAQRKPRKLKAYPFDVPRGGGIDGFETSIGQLRTYRAAEAETFLEIARNHDLGYNELVLANPEVDPWLPGDADVVLPTEWLLPNGRYRGLVLNIPEMRMYYYLPPKKGGEQTVLTFPVGLGRKDWQTPQGEFKIRGKTANPTWVIPESIRKERIEEEGKHERSIPGGSPDNPLGKHRIELTLPSYAIHGTNKIWGIGMKVSHGCVRMYPEDIEAFFPIAEVGGPGVFVYQPVKVGVSGKRVLVEVHEDIYSVAPWPWKLATEQLKRMGLMDRVDPELLEAALDAGTGIPTDVTKSSSGSAEAAGLGRGATGGVGDPDPAG